MGHRPRIYTVGWWACAFYDVFCGAFCRSGRSQWAIVLYRPSGRTWNSMMLFLLKTKPNHSWLAGWLAGSLSKSLHPQGNENRPRKSQKAVCVPPDTLGTTQLKLHGRAIDGLQVLFDSGCSVGDGTQGLTHGKHTPTAYTLNPASYIL